VGKATSRRADLQRRLAALNKEISNAVDAIAEGWATLDMNMMMILDIERATHEQDLSALAQSKDVSIYIPAPSRLIDVRSTISAPPSPWTRSNDWR
jgi:hypothetical protein